MQDDDEERVTKFIQEFRMRLHKLDVEASIKANQDDIPLRVLIPLLLDVYIHQIVLSLVAAGGAMSPNIENIQKRFAEVYDDLDKYAKSKGIGRHNGGKNDRTH